ncbi:protein ecdysoneless homolog [Helicoverpa zea]|uniref:protein ecdysoneless homolog n=1 Tax=Helicoverpa zea TaxID=7113 RepID=UPI001F588AEC|nr:protein ecdysoneless homolog [Helicoverpa zea]
MSSQCNLPVEPPNDDTILCLFFSSKFDSNTLLLEERCLELNNFIKSKSKDYIWHRDEFQVYVPIVNIDTDQPRYLCSTTCFGDNLEDEWFIVHIILELSKQYKDLIIQVKDNDGDFLLIEAANLLQSWANPESTENRVFISNHRIHIIPPQVVPLEDKLELQKALRIINETPHLTQASNEIQEAILNRIGNYPEKFLEHIHRAAVTLPSNLATLLTLKPSLIAPIVDAYCNHDVIDAKCCKNINFDDCITIEVKFTKFLYASLVHSKLITSVKHFIGLKNDKKNILGLKLMCGYQIIMNKASGNDLYSSKEYHRFLKSLKQNGYFRNNIEGSKEYNSLLERAQQYYSTVECPVSSHVSTIITDLMASNEFSTLKQSLQSMQLTEQSSNLGDNEDWLNINPEQLNQLLYTRYGKKSKIKTDDVVTSQRLTEELSSFLKETSDFEGIESDRNDLSEPDSINFDSDQFVSCIEKMLKILSTGTEHSESDESDEDSMDYNEHDPDECDKELQAKLQQMTTENLKDSQSVVGNIIQSMKEEKAAPGPSSNLMRSLGISKTELLDSDDDN